MRFNHLAEIFGEQTRAIGKFDAQVDVEEVVWISFPCTHTDSLLNC